MYSLLSLLTLLPLTLALPWGLSLRQTTCATGVHIIAARGSTQPPGEGSLATLSDQIEAAIPGSTSSAVVYPATLYTYADSVDKGVRDLRRQIQTYVGNCPNARLVLLGYSQGAQVVSDVLGGGTFSPSAPLDEKYRKNILAGILIADPTHVAGKSYDVGTADGSGIFRRILNARLDTYTTHIQSYCLEGDPVCELGDDLSKHFEEVNDFQASALKFVLGLAALSTTTTTTTTATT